MSGFVAGQRWRSEMEPELGVGIVETVEGRRVHLRFPLGDLTRIYAVASAPLARVAFNPGDRVADQAGRFLTVDAVAVEDGLLIYCAAGRRLREDQLGEILVFDTPGDRLLAGQREPSGHFDLRRRLLEARSRAIRSAAYGFVGGRVDLIAHQFATAAEVCDRRYPRVLLADETGLGKTIEAGLILHRLMAVGRIGRILVVVPDALVVQWFVELARRFNLQFRIFDDDTIRDMTSGGKVVGSFENDPLGLCGFSFLSASPAGIRDQLVAGRWDMIVVDEAHHMQPGDARFDTVRRLAQAAPRLILITATPGDLAAHSHFARLQLLDPRRYPDYGRFQRESEAFGEIARMVAELDGGEPLAAATVTALAELLGRPLDRIRTAAAEEAGRRRLVRQVIDRHGTGRVIFKSTRRTVSGFPGRRAHLLPLSANPADSGLIERLNREFWDDCRQDPPQREQDLDNDPRVDWLVDYLRGHRRDKLLLICRTAQKVNLLFAALERRISLPVGRFHEAMTLVQRDRNAAWFADPDGAVLLLCSEIGSEGRNFQFARHLVLFDLPADAELLEQRIGRLDRIGQTGEVQVLVPYVRGTGGEVLARWYHEALGAIETNVPAAGWVTRRLMEPLTGLVGDGPGPVDADRLNRLIRCGRLAAARQQRRIDAGRDRLLALGAPRPSAVKGLMDSIREVDADPGFADLIERLLDVWGINMEAISAGVYHLVPDHRYADPLPGFRPAGMAVTTDRTIALGREDLGFVTWDHPLVTAATDGFLGSGKGDTAFVHLPGSGGPAFFLEMLFIVEAAAPPVHFVQAFLPPVPIRVVVDHQLNDGSDRLDGDATMGVADGPASLFNRLQPLVARVLADAVAEGRRRAMVQAGPSIADALARADERMNAAIDRLKALAAAGSPLDSAAIDELQREKARLCGAIRGAAVRLDAIRLVACGDFS